MFTAEQIGTYYIWSSFTILLYLTEACTSTIMIPSRWDSDASLLYMQKQDLEFSTGITENMLKRYLYVLPTFKIRKAEDVEIYNSGHPKYLHPTSVNEG